MLDLEPLALAGLIGVLLLALAWHEAAHAWVADRLGDPTARSLGRISLNPIRHLDPFLSVILPAIMLFTVGFVVGGGKPVPINPARFRHPSRDFMLVALAGPGSNLLLALGFTLVFAISAQAGVIEDSVTQMSIIDREIRHAPSLLREPQSVFEQTLQFGVLVNVLLAFFNLMPIPPLDGSRLIGWLLPRPLQPGWYRLDRVGLLLVLFVFFALNGFQYVRVALDWSFGYFAALGDWLAALPLGGGAA